MADIADVESALVAKLAAALYPSGTSGASAATLADGSHPLIKIFAGWPIGDNLDADMTAGAVNVSVFPQAGMERNTTRYPVEWKDQTRGVATMAAAVSGSNVTLSGTVTVGQYVSILCFGQSWSYAASPGDTLAVIAAALATQIRGTPGFYAVSSGAVLTIAGQSGIVARIGAPGTIIEELERVNQRFMVTVFAPSPDARQAVARIIRPTLAAINFLTLADTSAARIVFESSLEDDKTEKAGVYRRSLFYWVEYPTTQVAPGYPITVHQTQIAANGASGAAAPAFNS